MKSSICSPRTIRKFFLVGAVLLSTCTLQSTIVFATCVLQKTNPSQTRFSIKLQNATLEEFVKQVEQKTVFVPSAKILPLSAVTFQFSTYSFK